MFDNQGRRKIGKSSVFTTEILMTAPAELDIERFSKKYRDLRRELLKALKDHAFGLRIKMESDSQDDLSKQIRNVINAGYSWSRSIDLEKKYGTRINSTYKKSEDKLKVVIDFIFNGIDVEE